MSAVRAGRIGVNVSWMTPGQAGGMEWYVRNLIAELGALDGDHEYVLVTSPHNDRTFPLPSARWRRIVYAGQESSPHAYVVSPDAPRPPGGWRGRLGRARRRLRLGGVPWWSGSLADLLRAQALDLWFCPFMYMVPVDADVPVVVTIPDLQHESLPHFFGEAELAYRTLGYQYSAQRAAAVIGISRWVADDIVARYGVDPDRAFGIPLGLDPGYEVSPDAAARVTDEVRVKYRLDYDYVFYPANGWSHKNHACLAAAVALLQDGGRDLRLILTGADFGVMDRLREQLGGARLARLARHLGYVDRADLVGLYRAARVLGVPSLFEGFGLPLLEAMHLGTPVVCGRVGSLPEVGGDAVAYVDPLTPEGMAAVLARVLDDKPYREALVEAGRVRVRLFSFRRTAEGTLDVFARVLAGDLRPPGLPAGRPLIPHNWLREGVSSWYFHAEGLRAIELEVVQPTRLPELAGQRLAVLLDGTPVADLDLDPERPRRLVVPGRPAPGGFHRLELRAARRTAVRGQVLSLQVREIVLARDDGRRVRLV